jgi:hypothetical protein
MVPDRILYPSDIVYGQERHGRETSVTILLEVDQATGPPHEGAECLLRVDGMPIMTIEGQIVSQDETERGWSGQI